MFLKDLLNEVKMQVAFTFDDATKDHILFAAPILEKYGYRGLFNIVTDVVGSSEDYLTIDDIRDLIRRGHMIASHGLEYHSGPNPDNPYKKWNRGEKDAAKRQILDSKIVLERMAATPVNYFCFPHNMANRQLLKFVRKSGMLPVRCSRPNFGGSGYPYTATSPGVWIDEALKKKRKYGALMFHGITRAFGGFAPFDDDDGSGFERCVREVKDQELNGSIQVVRYADVDWPVYDRSPLVCRILGRIKRMKCFVKKGIKR